MLIKKLFKFCWNFSWCYSCYPPNKFKRKPFSTWQRIISFIRVFWGGGWVHIYAPGVPKSSGCCAALLVDTPLRWTSRTVPLEWQSEGQWPLFLRSGIERCVPTTGWSHCSAALIRSSQWCQEVSLSGSRPTNSGGVVWFSSWLWNRGPALHCLQGSHECMGVPNVTGAAKCVAEYYQILDHCPQSEDGWYDPTLVKPKQAVLTEVCGSFMTIEQCGQKIFGISNLCMIALVRRSASSYFADDVFLLTCCS